VSLDLPYILKHDKYHLSHKKCESGDYSSGETPLPIPNREVKPTRANGTIPLPGWESRSSPGFFVLRIIYISFELIIEFINDGYFNYIDH
jgi:hypothetical protein